MSPSEQDRRRALKRERKNLDRIIHLVKADARPWIGRGARHLPSTRTKQAKWRHELQGHVLRVVGTYQAVVDRMHEIERELNGGNNDAAL